MRKIDLLVIAFILVASIFTLKDLFKANFYTSHDGIHQVVRLYHFDQALRDGQIPPRWAGPLLNGFGYPLFIFSYHLPWFIAEPLYRLGFSIFESIKMTFLIGFILSGIFMYLFQRELFGRIEAFVGTVIYLYAPYRFSNIFVRAAIGDATSFIFPPLLFLSLYKIRKKESFSFKWIALAAISFSSILLSHALVFLFFALFFLAYFFYWFIFVEKKFLFTVSLLLIIIFSIGVSSYYLFPSIIEKEFTKFSEVFKATYFNQTFVTLDKLIYSPWAYGTIDAKEGAMSLQLGIAQWSVFLLSTVLLLVLILRKKRKILEDNLFKEGLFYFLIFILSIFLMLPYSSFFWDKIKNFMIIDFVWRVLPVVIFSVSVLAGFFISKINYQFIFAMILITLAIYTNRNHLRINQVLDWPVDFYLKLEKTTNSYDEYTPRWVKSEYIVENKPKVEFSKIGANIEILMNKSNLLEFSLDTERSGIVRINTIYYPGWDIVVNGRKKDINYSNGLIELPIDKGEYRISAKFEETTLRMVSNLLSLLTMSIVVFNLLRFKKT